MDVPEERWPVPGTSELRVLIIEDDRDVSAYVRQGLTQAGWNVDVADDGRQGLLLATTEKYDALVVDRMLPHVEGLTLIRTLRASDNTTPALILSALGGDAEFLDRASTIALRPGVDWTEARMGTNAIGTALQTGAVTMVQGGQHYLERNRILTCVATPILAPAGGILGILDVSSDARENLAHARALLCTTAELIEYRLLEAFEKARDLEPGRIGFEIQIETSQAVLAADGTATVARMIDAAEGRATGLHYGTFDYSACLGVSAAHQASDHPAADHDVLRPPGQFAGGV